MNRALRGSALLLTTLLLGGCGTLDAWFGSHREAAVERARMERLVADDFASALVQLPAVDPDSGPLVMAAPETPFGNALLVALRSAGYRLEYGDEVNAERYLTYRVASQENQFGTSLGYTVSTGDVSLSRDYNMRSSGVFPISFLRVRGAPSEGLELDDERFRRQSAEETIISGISPDPALTSEAPAEVAASASGGLPLTEVNGQAIVDKRQIERVNMYDTRKSNFAEFLDNYQPVDTRWLVFPDDSLMVLPDVRTALQEMHAEFDPDTDVFSVIGCSHGPTALNNGNQLLAIGRSKRVLEELVTLGVREQQILDEGCWAGQHFDKMPARGVVVELRRLPG